MTGPHNMLGIELNEYAAELARVTVWIGELQWRLLHGYEFKTNPVLEPLDHIECRDALLAFDPARAAPAEAAWPQANVVIGNPPFLGGSKKRRELGDAYFEALARVFKDRVPAGADLVCYWFDKARMQMAGAALQAAGFVATQSVRSGSNRRVLDAIVKDVKIFDAWADEPWVNEGAAVRVSLVCFGLGQNGAVLNGKPVQRISADLSGDSGGVDLTTARLLPQNAGVSFEGTKKYGDFDISGELARSWLRLPNPHGKTNAEVLKPWRNGQGITMRPSDSWIIDFGAELDETDAALFEAPFAHVLHFVKPVRVKAKLPKNWWLHERPRSAMRVALISLARYIATVRVSKHRFFVFLDATV